MDSNTPKTVFRTIINLSGIEIDAYTANEKDDKGNWINYLSGRGMAKSIGLDNTTAMQKRLPKQLKDMLGADFTVMGGTYEMASGGITKIDLWTTQHAAKYYRYHDRKGNEQAGLIIDALSGTMLDVIINDAFDRTYNRGDAAKMVGDRLLDGPTVYRVLFSKEMCDRATAFCGVGFYWKYLYCWMTPEEKAKLNRLNPPINGRRNEYIHQYFPQEIRDRLLPEARILLLLLTNSVNKHDFKHRYRSVFGEGYQLELDLE